MKRIALFAAAALMVVSVGICFSLSGCETAEGLKGLVVEPGYVTLTPSSNLVVLSVSSNSLGALSLPIEWSMTDSSLGTLMSQSGNQVIYQRSAANGQNVIIARDQYESEAYVTIEQIVEQTLLVLTATPNPIPGDEDTTSIVVEGGELPYTWWVADRGRGSIISSGFGLGNVAIYRSEAGDNADENRSNVVHCEDANGSVGTIAILQLKVGDEPGGPGYTISIDADPNPIPDTQVLSVLTASGGVPPYDWDVDEADGIITGVGDGSSAQFTSTMATGESTFVSVTDANDVSATIVIQQD